MSCSIIFTPNISISGVNQPQTMFSPKRPLEMRSIVVAILAATIGCSVGTCEVANKTIFSVTAASAAAHV